MHTVIMSTEDSLFKVILSTEDFKLWALVFTEDFLWFNLSTMFSTAYIFDFYE